MTYPPQPPSSLPPLPPLLLRTDFPPVEANASGLLLGAAHRMQVFLGYYDMSYSKSRGPGEGVKLERPPGTMKNVHLLARKWRDEGESDVCVGELFPAVLELVESCGLFQLDPSEMTKFHITEALAHLRGQLQRIETVVSTTLARQG